MQHDRTSCPFCRVELAPHWIGGETEVFVRTFDRTAVLWVDLQHTTWQCVKRMMMTKWELDWYPRLLLHGRHCGDDWTVGATGLKPGDTIHLFLQLRGD